MMDIDKCYHDCVKNLGNGLTENCTLCFVDQAECSFNNCAAECMLDKRS